MHSEFKVESLDAQCHITLATANPDDTLSIEGIAALSESIAVAGRDASLKLIRIRSSGTKFLGGRKPGGPKPSTQSAREFRDMVVMPILGVYKAIHESEIPVLVEVQGDAIGFGCALVAAADLAISVDSAKFSLPEIEKNLPPTLVLSVFRSRVPAKAAAHLTYLGTGFDARQALAWGIVGEVMPGSELSTRGKAIAEWLVSRERIALTTLKGYYREAMVKDFSTASELAGNSLAVAMTSM